MSLVTFIRDFLPWLAELLPSDGCWPKSLFDPKQMQQVQEASLAGHRLLQRGDHLCRDGRPKAQPPRKPRAPRCWQSFRKLSEIGNGLRHCTSDGRLDLRANKPADQDENA